MKNLLVENHAKVDGQQKPQVSSVFKAFPWGFPLIEILIAGLLSSGIFQQTPVAPNVADPDVPQRLEDVDVIGRPLDSLVRSFVDEVAAPNSGLNLARWDRGVCVSSANFGPETAQYLVDRVSTVAEDLGLTPGRPGCRPNIIVVATEDPDALAEAFVRRRPVIFRPGGTGMDRGGAQLRSFRTSDRPVRWWAVSMPTDSETGQRAVRLSGDCQEPCSGGPLGLSPINNGPIINRTSSSRISTQIVDNMVRVIVVVDAGQLEGVSAQQLSDYVAMVSLAQIDPNADTSGYVSILNVFDDATATASLTDWDQAYLSGLYKAQRTLKLAGANRSEIIATIRRAHGDIRREHEAAD